jgi:hypothetical protein
MRLRVRNREIMRDGVLSSRWVWGLWAEMGSRGSGVAGRVAPGLAAGRKASGSRIAQMVSWGLEALEGGPRKGPRRAAGTRRFSGGNRRCWRRDVDC